MRSLLVVIASIVVVGGLFFGYTMMQSGSTHKLNARTGADPLPPPPTTQPGLGTLKPGVGVWVSTYDEKGELKNRFKSDDYQPQPDGKVKVKNPVAEFFMPNNRMMRLIGKTGEISMPLAAASNSNDGFGGGSPERGQIFDVIIQLFNMLPDAVPGVPDETIYTQNIEFDNATRLMTTEQYHDASGKIVPRDQVPVKMRSLNDNRGYDFDGRGLRLRWNDKDGRLDLLEVAHGEQLIVKDTSSAAGAFGGGHAVKPPGQTASAANARQSAGPLDRNSTVGVGSGIQTASGSGDGSIKASASIPSPTGKSATAASANNPPAIPIPYVATFYDNVRITQGAESLVTADRMDVDFVSRQNSGTMPANAPSDKASNPTNDHARPAAGVDANAHSPAVASADTRPAALATTSPTTKPASEPVVIRWTGKLVMLSAQANRPKVTPGDAIVELNGAPVNVRRTPAGQSEGDDVRAGKLVYHTADGSVKLVNSQAAPQVIISKLLNGKIDPQSTVTTATLDYVTDPAGRKIAILTGPGHAMMPLAPDATKHPDPKAAAVAMMDTHWQTGAKVFFREKSGEDLPVDHVDLAGDVDVKHPQLALKSQALSLYFDAPAKPAATQPSTENFDSAIVASAPTTRPAQGKPQQELKRVVASRAVHCVLAGQNGKKQTIDCTDLEMLTARSQAGKFYARQVNAGGAVHAFDVDQDLRADSVALTLKPAAVDEKKLTAAAENVATAASHGQDARATGGGDESDTAAVELEKMLARDNVLVTNKDGSSATGSELLVTTEDHQNHVRLTGTLAMVVDAKKNTVVGPLITFEQGVAHVVGPGKMHMLQEQQQAAATAADTSKPRPMDATWSDRAEMNGAANKIDLVGAVIVTTLDADGTANLAKGDRVHIDLIDKPAAATKPATQPVRIDAQADSMQMGAMKDKDARTITLEGNAEVTSTLTGDKGAVLRQFALFGPKIIYQLADSKELPAKTLLVPSAGRMFVGDHRPPDKKKPDEKKGDNEEAGGRGDTAFKWSKQLIYSETQHQATMTGDVLVVHQPLGKDADADRVRINADQVTALFEPQPHTEKPVPATQPAAALPATLPATRPATNPAPVAAPGESLQLKHLVALGHVIITRANGATLTADRVDFDPLTHWMIARGNENNPAHYTDPDPKRSMTAIEMQWNTETWDIKMTDTKTVNPK